ncbi:MAG: hypothetical protein EA428_04665 [Spirochaetaceae bacterium]|nr:MAG: hypothetical protein EA428_04665 [Spirochaetaceae bacterium]
MRTHKLFIGAALAAFVTVGAVATDTAPIGRDIARDGGLSSLQGEMVRQDGEWYIQSGTELHQLHMGPYGYANEDFLSGLSDVSATGFSVPGHMAPIQVIGEADTVEFWHEARYPQWAGEGERRNQVEERLGAAGERQADARALAFGRSDEIERRATAARSTPDSRTQQAERGRPATRSEDFGRTNRAPRRR